MGSKILVTSNANPDLDGYASALAYADFLVKQGKEAEAILIGKIDRETEFVVGFLHDQALRDYQGDINEAEEVIMVDNSNHQTLEKEIEPAKVTEVIDHRAVHQADQYPWAKVQIEKIGACATLIAEKYFKNKIEPDEQIATYLYAAIASNTINFKNRVTTERDIQTAKKLKQIAEIDDDFIEEMFIFKSDLEGEKLPIHIKHDYYYNTLGDKHFSIFQLEIVHINEMVKNRLGEIKKVMEDTVAGKDLDFYFMNIIDILEGYNIIFTPDQASQQLLKEVLGVDFDSDLARTDHIIMRKEIVAKIKEYLEQNPHS